MCELGGYFSFRMCLSLFHLSHERTETAPFVWIMSFDRSDLFSLRINQSLKFSTWHFQAVSDEESVAVCFLKQKLMPLGAIKSVEVNFADMIW